MKIFFVAGLVSLAVLQFFCQAYSMELCEPQDYYNLANSTKCKVKYDKAGNKDDYQNSMFEIMKNYPFESKDAFMKLFQRKIELINNYKIQQQAQGQTEKNMNVLSRLEHAKQILLGQLEMVKSATRGNWVSVRDQASASLQKTVRNLREIK